MKLLFSVLLILTFFKTFQSFESPACLTLLSLGKTLPDAYKTPKLFKSLRPSDFKISAIAPLELNHLKIPLKITFFFNKEGKLTYQSKPSPKSIQNYASKYKDPKIAREIIRKTVKTLALSALESIIKEGLKTKIGLTFPHLGFFIAIEEILNIYKPHLTRKGEGKFDINYYYKLGGEKVISRLGMKIRFNRLKIAQAVKMYESRLEKFELIWKSKKSNNDIDDYSHIIKERLVHLDWNLDNVLQNKNFKGRLVEVDAKKVGKSIIFDQEIYENYLNELKKNVLSPKFSRSIMKLKNSYCGSFNWYEQLLSDLKPKSRLYAKNNIKFIYETGSTALVSSRGFLHKSSFNTDDKMKKNGVQLTFTRR